MPNPLKSILRSTIESLGFRVFKKDTFYNEFLPYSRWGTEPIHQLRHFVDTREIKCCVDVGANKGQTAAYFSAVFPSATIYSFEPVSGTYANLVANTKHLPRVETFNYALGRTSGAVDIALAADDQLNTLVAAGQRDLHERTRTESILVRTLDTFMSENHIEHINFLKTDTEGFDIEVLHGASNAFTQRRIDLVYCEVGFHSSDLLHTHFNNALRFMEDREFAFLGLYDTVFCDNPTQLFHANALFGSKHSKLIKPWKD